MTNEQIDLVPRDRGNGAALVPSAPVTLDLIPREPRLADYLLVLRKHRWLIASFFVATVTIVAIATFRMQPMYQATARIEIDPPNTNMLPFQGSDMSYDAYAEFEAYVQTQAKILVSQTMAMKTIKSLNLDHDPRVGGQPVNPASVEVAPADNGLQLQSPAVGAFVAGLSIKLVPNTRLMDVAFTGPDPKLAAAMVNAHINTFVEENFRSRYDATTQASTWLAGQLDELKAKVEDSEDKLSSYERANQIWTVDGKEDITTQKVADLQKEVTGAQADRINKEAAFQLAQSGNDEAIPAIRENALLQGLRKQINDLSAQYAEALSQYGPQFPKVVRLQEQQKDLVVLLDKEKKNIINEVEADYQGARQREMLLQETLDQQKNQAAAMADKMVEYNILKRDAEADKQLYDGLLQKLKEAGISAGLRSSNIRVVDPALPPSAPFSPQKTRNILFAAMVGLIGGIGLALVREYLDNTVKNPDDIENLSRLPSLAVVPAFLGANGKNGRPKLLKGAAVDGNAQGGRVELVSHDQPRSQISEAFRALRTSLLLSQADRPPQVILVTSALPREGKTTAAVNLAVTLAQLGDKTVLVDGDLRKPGVSRALNLVDSKHAGLSSYLAGVSTLDLVTVPHPVISNLATIPTGPVPPNPADLLSSHRLGEMITDLRKRYKFVVIDSPPVMAATDAVLLSVMADGVLIVVRSGQTPKEAFMRTHDLLMSVKCHVLGVVLNAVDSSSPDYYYSYRYYPYTYGEYGREDRDRRETEADRTDKPKEKVQGLGL